MIELVVGLLVGVAIGCLVGLAGGLYLGEKGRREAAERQVVYGNAAAAPRATVLTGRPDPEARIRDLGYDPKTIERGADDLMAQFKKAGLSITREEAMQQVQAMLHPDYQPPELNL